MEEKSRFNQKSLMSGLESLLEKTKYSDVFIGFSN
jgi:hypothetical protein